MVVPVRCKPAMMMGAFGSYRRISGCCAKSASARRRFCRMAVSRPRVMAKPTGVRCASAATLSHSFSSGVMSNSGPKS
jgi:hypothetical protein